MRKYGWPMVLFIGVPIIAIFVRPLYFYPLDSGFFNNDSTFLLNALFGLAKVVLLGVLFPWVCNSERATLRLVWSCTLVLAAATAIVSFSAVLADLDIWEYTPVLWTVSILSELAILLWFARGASRLSLAHALFLVTIVGGLWFPDLPNSLPIFLSLFWDPVWILATGILAVWLISNFDLGSESFRKWSVVAVVAWQGLEFLSDLLQALNVLGLGRLAYSLYFEFLVLAFALSFPLTLLLVYFVRVRQSPDKVTHPPTKKEP